MKVDFLLIGQGIAGTVLSYQLMQAGKTVMVLDTPAKNNSTRVAAGLYNPITGRKMVKTWRADDLFPEIIPLYSQLEKLIAKTFIYPAGIYRPFFGVEEQNEWMGKSSEPEVIPYLQGVKMQPYYPEVNNPHGGILLQNSGYLDLPTLMDGYREHLSRNKAVREEEFDEEFLLKKEDHWEYKDIEFSKLIYCNGLGAMKSSFFGKLPFAPVKGEILEISSDFQPRDVINRGVFRITMPDGRVRVGSTYSWHDLEDGPTEQGREEVLERLEKIVPGQVQGILSHKSGIRPATKDRKPFLGKHPEEESVYIFNGFGAKGVSLVPYFSKMMLRLLIEDIEPEKDVNISRFFNYI